MKTTFLTIFAILYLTASSENYKVLDLKAFTIQVPENWSYIKMRGIDSYIGAIAIDSKDTLHFDYGLYSNSLEESFNGGNYYISNNDSIFIDDLKHNKLDTINGPYYKFLARGGKNKLLEFKKDTSYYEMISGLKAKIVIPKNMGTGTTGIFFENTRTDRKGMRLQISGSNLSLKNHKAFLKAMKTIKFKN
jgi:hypothetical protein